MNRNHLKGSNSVATRRFVDAYKLHRLLFRHIYPYPFDIEFGKHTISVKIDKILRFKYIPFFVSLILITTVIGFGTCAFLPVYKLFKKSVTIDVIAIVLCLFLGSCAVLEWATYLVCSKSTEIVSLINQLFQIERVCKFFIVFSSTKIHLSK